jgi:hypothetical protein
MNNASAVQEEDTKEQGGKQRGRKAPGEVFPTFPGEEIQESEEPVDAKELMVQLIESLGGLEAYRGLEDINFKYMNKQYNEKALLFKETAKGFISVEERPKIRLDFDYIRPDDPTLYYDYREVFGEDGPFKYIDGKVLKRPVNIREAGERTLRTGVILLVPFCLDFGLAEPRYIGVSAWDDEDSKEKVTLKCHKILVQISDDRANIDGNTLALYLDTKTNELRRMVFNIYTPGGNVKRVRIINFKGRDTIGGIQLPSQLTIKDIWQERVNARHKVVYSDYQFKTGLKGIGFEMFNQ